MIGVDRRFAQILGLASITALAFACREQSPNLPVVNSRTLIQDLVRSEEITKEIQSMLQVSLLAGIQEQRSTKSKAALAENFRGHFPAPGAWQKEGFLEVCEASQESLKRNLSKREFLTQLQGLTEQFARIERLSWRPFRSSAFESSAGALQVEQEVHFSLAGRLIKGGKLSLRATIKAQIKKGTKNAKWELKEIEVREARFVKSKHPVFVPAQATTGFTIPRSKVDTKSMKSIINERNIRTSGGLSVIDFNRDGFADIIASEHGHRAVLFMNDKQGGFTPQALLPKLAPEDVSKAYLWIDLDNDGQEELVGSQVLFYGKNQAELGLYKKRGRKLKRVSFALQFSNPSWVRGIDIQSVVPCDVNGDQLLDLLFVGYEHSESKIQPNMVDAKDGLRNLLFINQGGLRFREEGLRRGLTQTQYSLVAACFDFDQDGDFDFFIGNDYGRNNYYENDGRGYFRHDEQHPFHVLASWSMGISIADPDNQGSYSLAVSNMYSHAGSRIVPLARGLSSDKRQSVLRLAEGNSWWKRKNGKWIDAGEQSKLAMADWAWGNSFFDFDNDGDKDLYVVNGYTTHEDPHLPDY